MKFFILIILLILLIILILDVKRDKNSPNKENEKDCSKYQGGSAEYRYAVKYVDHLNDVRDVASEILSGEWRDENIKYDNPDAAMDIYPWDEFAYTMLRNPDSVKFDFDKCPICDNERFQIYHQELKNEGKEEYEENGQYVLICPKCKKYFGYELPQINNNQLSSSIKMENTINKDFSGIWTASRIIENLSEMIKMKGGNTFEKLSIETYEYDESNPWSIRYWRLMSVLKAYGKSIGSFPSVQLFCDFVSPTLYEKKLAEIDNILKETTSPENADAMNKLIRSTMQEGDIRILSNIFYSIFYTYLSYKKISEPFAGVIETSRPIFYTLQFVEQSSYKATHKLQQNLKRLLVLLMGDDFDTPVSEKELIEKYNYPTISDQELDDLMIEYM